MVSLQLELREQIQKVSTTSLKCLYVSCNHKSGPTLSMRCPCGIIKALMNKTSASAGDLWLMESNEASMPLWSSALPCQPVTSGTWTNIDSAVGLETKDTESGCWQLWVIFTWNQFQVVRVAFLVFTQFIPWWLITEHLTRGNKPSVSLLKF